MDKRNVTVASPARGRRTMHTDVTSAELVATDDREAGAAALIADLRQDSVAMPKGELAQSLQLAETAGMIAAFQYNETANRVAMLKAFQQIRESRAYRGMVVRHKRTGGTVTVVTWEEFCEAHGYSHQKIGEDLRNLTTFGGDFLALQESLGLGYREMRRLRMGIDSLPPEEREKVLNDVQNVQGQDEAVEKLEEVRTRLAGAEIRVRELSATMKAREEVSKKKSAQIDELETRLERLEGMTPDEAEKASQEAQAKARAAIDGECQAVFVAVMALCGQCAAVMGDSRTSEETCAYVHQRVSLLLGNVADAILAVGVDADLRAMVELPDMGDTADVTVQPGPDTAGESPEQE